MTMAFLHLVQIYGNLDCIKEKILTGWLGNSVRMELKFRLHGFKNQTDGEKILTGWIVHPVRIAGASSMVCGKIQSSFLCGSAYMRICKT